jgi:peptidoglycan/LPS O-acetylase OafA/YrhL
MSKDMMVETKTAELNLPASTQSRPQIRPYLDGIRGLAALYVLFHHAAVMLQFGSHANALPHSYFHLLRIFDFGHYAVDVFIVLSGFCLMMPIAKSGTLKLTNPLEFVERRAWRIIPPYYAAIAVSIILNAICYKLYPNADTMGNSTVDRDFFVGLLAHILLVHNLIPHYIFQFNWALWSVATEWQIYFIFMLILLPASRKIGLVATTVLALVVSTLPHFLLRGQLDGAAPWYIALFAFGMCGAWWDYNGGFTLDGQRRTSGLLALAAFLLFAIVGVWKTGWFDANRWAGDTVIGLGSVALILYCSAIAKQDDASPRSLTFKLFSSRAATKLGAFSYSIYLVHCPVLNLIYSVLIYSGMSPSKYAVLLMTVGTMVTLAITWLFYAAVEAPVLRIRSRRRKTVAA